MTKLWGLSAFSLVYWPVAGCCEHWAKLVQWKETLTKWATVSFIEKKRCFMLLVR